MDGISIINKVAVIQIVTTSTSKFLFLQFGTTQLNYKLFYS